jgi:hypothetical protein
MQIPAGAATALQLLPDTALMKKTRPLYSAEARPPARSAAGGRRQAAGSAGVLAHVRVHTRSTPSLCQWAVIVGLGPKMAASVTLYVKARTVASAGGETGRPENVFLCLRIAAAPALLPVRPVLHLVSAFGV